MARKKVQLKYIENENARKATYKKRVQGIIKKTQELSVLCGVDACTVIYGPYEQAPVVWPSTEDEARRILLKFKNEPEMAHSQRTFDQKDYLKQTVIKEMNKAGRLVVKKRELQMENLAIQQLAGKLTKQVAFADYPDLIWVMKNKLRALQSEIYGPPAAISTPDAIASAGDGDFVNPSNIPDGMMGGESNTLTGEGAPGMMQAGPSQQFTH